MMWVHRRCHVHWVDRLAWHDLMVFGRLELHDRILHIVAITIHLRSLSLRTPHRWGWRSMCDTHHRITDSRFRAPIYSTSFSTSVCLAEFRAPSGTLITSRKLATFPAAVREAVLCRPLS